MEDLCFCGRHLDSLLWQAPGERACDTCEAQWRPAPKLHRIRMSFVLRNRWQCIFTEQDLRTQAAPARSFLDPDDMDEMIRRGNGSVTLPQKQAVEPAIIAERGNVDIS